MGIVMSPPEMAGTRKWDDDLRVSVLPATGAPWRCILPPQGLLPLVLSQKVMGYGAPVISNTVNGHCMCLTMLPPHYT